MYYALSFADTFFWGEDLRDRPNPRPTNVLQALISLPAERQAELARNVFEVEPDQLEMEAVLLKVVETNTCRNLDSPVEVFIDPAGDYTLLVYDG